MSKYHFIAIGGIGMSGLAKYLLEDGHLVSGSDISDSKYIKKLRDLGATIYIGHDSKNVPEDATIIVSSAIKENNPELIKAKELGLKIYHRSDMLKEISEMSKSSGMTFVGFSGTHGKTTTSGMASYVLDKANLNPSFVDGGIVPELSTNAQHKRGKYFVAELDESDGTITKYSTNILVINNLEEDHLDFYKNGMKDLIKTFQTAINNSEKVLVNIDNKGVNLLEGNFITFGVNKADYMAKNINIMPEFTTYDLFYKDKFLTQIKIQLAGIHNVYNSLAVASALIEAGIDINQIQPYFIDFTGMGRRFQKVLEFNSIQVFDDYAHHPTEIMATLNAAIERYGKDHVVAVFQPHRYTRLQSLWNDFKNALQIAERVFVTDVYSASEDKIEGISGDKFASELDNSEYLKGNMQEVADQLLPKLKHDDIVIGLGAGTITELGKKLEKLITVQAH